MAQPTVITQITSIVPAGYGDGGYGDGGYGDDPYGPTGMVIGVNSTYAMYVGALVVVGWNNADAEIVTILQIQDATHFIALLVNTHNPGETVLGPTFPTQEATDPLFTQSEMLAYVSRAQNEMLTAIPSYYQRFFQTVNAGVIFQNTPTTAIVIDRIAASSMNTSVVGMVRSGNVVTLTTAVPHGLSKYSTFAVSNPGNNLTDLSFLGGAFAVISAPSPTSITYRQIGANSTASGGNLWSMLRLYEGTQEELVMQNRFWQSNYTGPLQSWFEDRSGLYRWGVGGRPSTSYPVELLCAVRDTDTLGLLDGFLVPDMIVHGIKYLAMSYALSKDGVYQQPEMADFCLKRYTQVVMATQRYMEEMKMEMANAEG